MKITIPAIRFRGFTGQWEERKLENVVNVFDNLRIPISESERPQGSTPYYGANGIQDYIDGFTHDGEFILVAEDGANNLKNYPVHYVNGKVWVNNHAHVLQAIMNEANTLFLKYRIQSIDMTPYLVGGGRAKLNANTMKKIVILAPSRKEQTTIGQLFKQIDRLLSNLQIQHEKNQQFKQAMLGKIFPKAGSRVPEIRLKGFSGEWEERTLGEIAEFYKGKGLSKSSLTPEGRNPCILYGELYTKYGRCIKKVYSATNDIVENPTLSKENDVLLPTSDVTPNGLAKACAINEENIVLGGDILVIRTKEMKNSFFAYYIEANPSLIIERASGTTVFHIYAKDLQDLPIPIPSEQEQTAIGQFFQQTDRLLALQRAKIEKLQRLKTALLAKMMV